MNLADSIERLEAVADRLTCRLPPDHVEAFCKAELHNVPGAKVLFADFYESFLDWLPPYRRHEWSRIAVSRALPHPFQTGRGNANKTFIINASWSPGEGGRPLLIFNGQVRRDYARTTEKTN